MDLGANEWTTFWKVTFPLILPGVMAAALLAFSLSIDDFVITNFTSGQTADRSRCSSTATQRRGIPVAGQRHRHDHLRGRRRARAARRRSGSAASRRATTDRAARLTAGSTGGCIDGRHRPTPGVDGRSPPRPFGRAAGLGPDHQPRRRSRRGLVADHRDGERYLDYSSGIGVTNTGHAHPRVAAAIAAQAAKLLHGQQNILYHEPGLRLYERLRHVLPGGPWQAFLSNSGAEAVEASVKLARVATGPAGDHRLPLRLPRPHGPDDGADDGQGRLPRRRSSRCPGSVYHTAYPYCYRAAGGAHSPDACTCDWEAQLDLTFHQFIYPDQVAAVIIEPVLGEGGYIVPPPGFLPRLREITRQHGILLIADEVQTGLRADRRDVRGPALGRRAGHPGHGQGDRLGAATLRDPGPRASSWPPGSRAPTAARTAATSCRAPRPTRRSTSSRTRAWSPTPASAGRSSSAGSAQLAGAVPIDRRRARPRADGRARARQAGRRRRPRRPTPT